MATVDVLSLVDEWRSRLNDLHAKIREWSKGLELPPHIESHRITINEELTGPYEVTELIFTHLGRHMKVRPVAVSVVGADGRVDITGSEGPFTLVYLSDEGGWFLVGDRPPGELQPLTRELFLNLAEACLK